MTDEYKKKILDWLCGKDEIESGEDDPQMGEFKTITNNLRKYIWDNYFTSTKPQIFDIVRGKNSNNEPLDNYIIYGYYYDNAVDKNKGFLIVLDKYFNPIQGINKYSSDVQIGEIMRLDVDEDGTWYIIEKRYNDNVIRFMLLNNILLKSDVQTEYQVKIRKSYEIPSTVEFPDTIYKMIKQYGGSNYIFAGTLSDVSRNISLKINTGSENEWGQIVFPIRATTINDVWANWDSSDNLDLIIVATDYENYIYIGEWTNGQIVKNDKIKIGTFYIMKITILNSQYAYMLATSWSGETDKSIYNSHFYKINLSTNKFTLLRTMSYKNGYLGNGGYFDLVNDGINVYYFLPTPNDLEDYSVSYYMGLIYNDKVYIYFAGNFFPDTNFIKQNITNKFNLFNYYLQIGNELIYAYQILNNNNYNGLPYNNVDALVPNSGILYDNDNNPIFARNLYNKTVRGWTTVSTIEVPNTQLNDISISKNNLLGKTNVILNSVNNVISKNIYETLNINFVNTLTMRNENDIGNKTTNVEGASKLNKSLSELTDYDNSKLSKYKINYNDNSSSIFNIDSSQVNIQGEIATIKIVVYNPSENNIRNIDLISNDETTVYLNIDCSSMLSDGCYLIKQNVEIN